MSTSLKVRSQGIHYRELEGELVILDLETSNYFALNPTGTLLWPLLTAGASRAELVAELCAQCDIEPEPAAADVDAFLETLRESGLLEG